MVLKPITYHNYMSNRQQQMLQSELQSYFQQKSEKVTKEEVSPIAKLAQSFAKGNRAPQFVKLTFSCFKKHLKKQHFGVTCSRFLKLIDELLQLSGRVPVFKPYAGQSALNWKIYRMLWAKLITDQAFDTLRHKIAEKFNKFDLNRGFNDENIERIKRRYNRKGFTESEINRYLDSTKLQPKKSSSVEPTLEPGLQPQKKRNVDLGRSSISPASRQNPKEMNPMPRSYSPFETGIHPNHYQQTYPNSNFGKDPYYYQQQNNPVQPYANYPPQPDIMMGYGYNNLYMNPPLSNYPPIPVKPTINSNLRPPNYPYLPPAPPANYSSPPNAMLPPNLGMQMGYNLLGPGLPTNYNMPTANPSLPNKMMPPNLPNQLSKLPNMPDTYPEKNFHSLKEPKPLKAESHKSLNPQNTESLDTQVSKQLRISLIGHLHQCRECGLLVQTKQYLQQHVQSHLLQAQQEYFRKESESMGQTKPANSRPNGYLLPAERWANFHSQTNSKPYQISIAGLNRETGTRLTYHCYFCQQQLTITWCEELQDWTLKDTIKLRTEEELTVSHFSCFNHFSPDTPTR